MVPVLMLERCAWKAESGSGAPLPWDAQLWFWFLCWHLLYFLLGSDFTLTGAATFPRLLSGHHVP